MPHSKACFCLLALLFAILPGFATAAHLATVSASPTAYQITSLADLEWMAITDNVTASTGKYYALMNDIDTTATASAGYNGGTDSPPLAITPPTSGNLSRQWAHHLQPDHQALRIRFYRIVWLHGQW